jgi:hypothetical protein
MTGWPNAYGKPSFGDMDESWYRYMKADHEERNKMCDEVIDAEVVVLSIVAVFAVIGVIIALAKGWV